MWLSLFLLAVGCAVVPTHLLMIVLMLRSPRGRSTALAFLAGMILVRLAQGAIFGALVDAAAPVEQLRPGPSTLTAALMLAVATLLIVGAIRAVVAGDDGDTPERWVKLTSHLRPRTAFALGIGVVVVGMRFWVLTLGAVAVIDDARLGGAEEVAVFLVFVAASLSPHMALIGAASVAPGGRADQLLSRLERWFRRHRQQVIVAVGFGFGGWLLIKSLDGLGIL